MKIKKRWLPVFLCCLALLLSGCGREVSEETTASIVSPIPTTETTAATERVLPETTVATAPAGHASLPSELAAFEAVLMGSQEFYLPESQEYLHISEVSKVFTPEEMPWNVVQFAVLDMDGDGTLEAVLEVSNYIGFVILRYQENGAVSGHGVWYRAFQELKADGSYMGSGSSFNHSYYRQHPGGDILLAECYEDETGVPHYWLDGQEVDAEAFAAFEAQQQSKPAATWYQSWQDYLSSR